ncbi:conserved hypothetical protein [Ricinus communis]|uniref:CCHC-type domain-containing protein n=1 Tax=Ricinus communis TaxID=3988 RepID=B9S852_RICCO|nr:conserved hypothetical protein [Ricinus communis]
MVDGLWSSDKCLIVFSIISETQHLGDVLFDKVNFWVQIHNVSVAYISIDVAKKLGNEIGQVVDIDGGTTGSSIGRYLRVCVIDMGNKEPKRVVVITYECLLDICYACDMLGHVYRECSLKNKIALDESSFGPWMKAVMGSSFIDSKKGMRQEARMHVTVVDQVHVLIMHGNVIDSSNGQINNSLLYGTVRGVNHGKVDPNGNDPSNVSNSIIIVPNANDICVSAPIFPMGLFARTSGPNSPKAK